MKITVWLHRDGKKYRLPVAADHVQISGSELRAIRGSDIWAVSHANPHDVSVLRLRKPMQKAAWRAVDGTRGRFTCRGSLLR